MRHRYLKITSLKNQALIADKCFVADRFFDRLRGLIGRKSLAQGEGMFFPACNDIHMWFMSIAIDVVFVRKEKDTGKWRVSSVHRNVRPWRVLPLRDGHASETIELPVGTIQRCDLVAGDALLCTS